MQEAKFEEASVQKPLEISNPIRQDCIPSKSFNNLAAAFFSAPSGFFPVGKNFAHLIAKLIEVWLGPTVPGDEFVFVGLGGDDSIRCKRKTVVLAEKVVQRPPVGRDDGKLAGKCFQTMLTGGVAAGRVNEGVRGGELSGTIFFGQRAHHECDYRNVFERFTKFVFDQCDDFCFEVDEKISAPLWRAVKHERYVIVGREFFDEGADKDVDARGQHSIGDCQKLKRSCRHAWKLKWGSPRTEKLRIESLGNDADFVSLDTRCCERLAVKLTRQPNFVERVASLGPAVGYPVGAKGGATDPAAPVEVEIPICGRPRLIENAFGEVEVVVGKSLEIS